MILSYAGAEQAGVHGKAPRLATVRTAGEERVRRQTKSSKKAQCLRERSIMKKTVIIVLLLMWFPVLAFAAPAIRFESETHNFGRVDGEWLNYSFDFTNAGTEELVIQRISPP